MQVGSGGGPQPGAALIATIDERPSPNHGPRRDGDPRPTLIVLHYTAMKGGPGPAIRRLCDPATEVSCHYVLGEKGEISRLVPDDRRAWHAGAGRWGDVPDVNSRSLGIEISNDAASPFPAPQMQALGALLAHLMALHSIPPEAIIGHSDCAPGRKIDPGCRFDWRALAYSGLSIWPAPRTAHPDTFAASARAFGYTAAAGPETLLTAFRLRFRPGIRGPLDETDAGLAADLAARFPAPRLCTASIPAGASRARGGTARH